MRGSVENLHILMQILQTRLLVSDSKPKLRHCKGLEWVEYVSLRLHVRLDFSKRFPVGILLYLLDLLVMLMMIVIDLTMMLLCLFHCLLSSRVVMLVSCTMGASRFLR